MKKLLIILALSAFASCGNDTSASDTTKDSLKAVDAAANAQKENIDAAAKAQKNTIDSVKQLTNAQIDSEAAAKKDSLKGK